MLPILLAALERPLDKAVFIQFYETNKTGLYRYALSLLRDPSQAEDVLQTAWLACIQHADTFFAVPPEKRLSWMAVIVRNAALNLLRREQRYTEWDDAWDPPAPEDGDSRGIAEIIRSMPEQYRTILELKFLLELSDKEIARRVHLSPTAVSTRISRGRKLLQDALRKEGYVDE